MGQAAGLLSRERTIAGPGFNRWLVPPAAVAIHMCIGMVYGWSVFWLPLSQAVGLTHPAACPAGTGLFTVLTTTHCDWTPSNLKQIFTIGILFLGGSAALWGGWLERAGPRKAGLVAALCWPGGLAVTALGVYLHQLWLMWLGGGVIGGIGLGLGYISPVSTLVKWFPDRRGMATGMAIMGFGGGAMFGAPLANLLMAHFRGPGGVGVWQTLLVLAVVYAVLMAAGAFGYRVPPDSMVAHGSGGGPSVPVESAHKTAQFWLLWGVLCLNVSAGIGVLEMASPMLQEIFAGKLIGAPAVGFSALSPDQKKEVAAVAAGFIGFLSLFNILGRFFWASLSDRIGRRNTYTTFFILGMVLYAAAPRLAHAGSVALFAAAFAVILSMYGGGFATIPAYLADIFGAGNVGAIHGRLLTAWSAAGLLGPEIVNDFRDHELARGVPRAQVYDEAMYVLAGLLVAGLACNLAVRRLAPHWFTYVPSTPPAAATEAPVRAEFSGAVLVPWVAIGIPLAWGFYQTVIKASALFR
ncbi:MAG TPA: OFA family MFS transporter [Acetobacteraceae bacterium]|nr:OFA family MFS transporter [Acetobacteraceae bacterium]